MPFACLPFVLLLLLGGAGASRADDALLPAGEGYPISQSWTPRDYHAPGGCRCFAQDARGVLYAGAKGNVLEYDGATWRPVPTGDAGDTQALGYDAGTDTVFVGKEDDLGYLKMEPGGAHTYVSLREQVPPEARNAGRFEKIFATPEGVYFVGSDTVLRWRDGRFKAWKLPTGLQLRGHWAAGRLYVASTTMGLRRLEGEEFVSASEDPIFHQTDVFGLLPSPDGTLLLCSNRRGFFAVRDGVATKLDSECDAFLKDKTVVAAARLRDGSLAVGTINGGVVILDPALRFRSRLDRTVGLFANYVAGLFVDAEGGLWVSQASGAVRAEVESALSIYRAGPDEDTASTTSIGRWRGAVAVANANGVYRLAPADPAAALGPRLELLTENINAANGMCTVDNGVFAVANGRLEFLDAERKQTRVLDSTSVVVQVVASRAHPGRVYFLTQRGRIGILRFDEAVGKWVEDGTAADLGLTSRFQLKESPAGDLWVGTVEHGLFRVRIDPAGGAAKVTVFYEEPGPLHGVGWVLPCKGDGPLVFKTRRGLYRFDEGTAAVVKLTAFGEELQDGSTSVDACVSYDSHSLWLTCQRANEPQARAFRGRIVAGGPEGTLSRQALPRQVEALVGEVRYLHPVEQAPEELRSVLIVGSGGNAILRLDVARWEAAMRAVPRAFTALVRRAFTTQGEGVDEEKPILREPLEYGRNTAHFEYAAGTLAFGAAPKFQTRLAGFGAGNWSDWTARTDADYLNLPEGRYTFDVRARNADGQMSRVASMPFRVLPPWQRSPWAYAGYALAFAAALAGFVRWRGRQLRSRNVALESIVDARTAELRGREAELVRARDDAEAANRAKSAFLANMSHELRTPLNAVLGYAQLLLKQPDLTVRSREQATVIGQSGGHLLSLVNEVLDLSKVEAGKLTLRPFDFPLGQLLDEVGVAFRPRLAEKKLTYTETRAPGLPGTVRTDPSRLRQVLFNLLSNAVKFTQHGGVTLAVRPTDERRVRFEVADTGVGIAPEDQRDIFVAFYQAGEGHLASQGTGLGLTISQRLVELLGGRIELESTPGHGSRFWFELPLGNVEARGGAADRTLPDSVLGSVKGYEGATRRLLLVDDLIENRRVLRDFLQPLGFEIEEAADGPSALTACARATPDAVLLDLRLGAMDGFEVASALRASQNGRRPGIIAISASVFESDRQQAIDAGCDDFLPKPFEEAQLLGVLGRVLSLRWVRATPAPATLSEGGATLPAGEIELLRKLSRRGDTVGIRRHLDARRTESGPGRTDELARRLEALLAAYDLDGIDALLLNMQSHANAIP